MCVCVCVCEGVWGGVGCERGAGRPGERGEACGWRGGGVSRGLEAWGVCERGEGEDGPTCEMVPFALCAVTTPLDTSTGVEPPGRLVQPTCATVAPLIECAVCT